MDPVRRLRLGIVLLVAVITVGAFGYVVVADVSFFVGLYMVAITITTVGFGEVSEFDTAARVWTLVVMAAGLGTAFYTAGVGFEHIFILRERRRRTQAAKVIDQLSDHIIVCGYGRVGQGTAERLVEQGADVVIIEANEIRFKNAVDEGLLAIAGDATSNQVLEDAGIGRARALVACVSKDSDNLVIVLSAKAIAPDTLVVSRATDQESEPKLKLAGADRVVAPQAVGSERLAALALQPALTDFFDIVVGGRAVEFLVEEIEVVPGSTVDGLTIRDSAIRETSGALILAVEDEARTMLVNPDPELVLRPGQKVVCIGTRAQVDSAGSLLG